MMSQRALINNHCSCWQPSQVSQVVSQKLQTTGCKQRAKYAFSVSETKATKLSFLSFLSPTCFCGRLIGPINIVKVQVEAFKTDSKKMYS